MEEILTLLRENNEMLKRICTYIDKVESPNYQMERQMTSFAINVAADRFGNMIQTPNNNNDQIFFR